MTTSQGNIRIFEGVWESSDFYLQRILNVVETLPPSDVSRRLWREVFAILKISEEMAARRGLLRFCPGKTSKEQGSDIPSPAQMEFLCSAMTFSASDLERLQIMPTDLEPFVFPLENRTKLSQQALGDSELERRPIVQDGGKLWVLLPTAISVAVRQRVLTWMHQHGY